MADGRVPDEPGDPERSLRAALLERDRWAQEAFESKRFAAALAIERQNLADALVTADARAREGAALLVDAARQERDAAIRERDAAWNERDRARAAAYEAEAILHRVTTSTAWRLTAPVRLALMALLGRSRRL